MSLRRSWCSPFCLCRTPHHDEGHQRPESDSDTCAGHARLTHLLLFRIHRQGIRAGTMRMEESTVPLLEVPRNVVLVHFHEVFRDIGAGVVVIGRVILVVTMHCGVRERSAKRDGHRWTDVGRERERVKKGSKGPDA